MHLDQNRYRTLAQNPRCLNNPNQNLGTLAQTMGSLASASPASVKAMGAEGVCLCGKAETPHVLPGAVRVTGKLPPEVIQRVIRQATPQFRSCYKRALGDHSELEGSVTVVFTINARGGVVNAHDDHSTLASAATVACMLQVVSALKFAQPPSGEVEVVESWQFKPG